MMSDLDILSEFFTHNLDKTISVATPETFAPYNMPRNTVGVRIERWHGLVYITNSAITTFAKERGFDRHRLEKIIEELGGVRASVNMLSNTNLDTMRTKSPCWKLNMNAENVKLQLRIPEEGEIAEATQNTSSSS